MQYFKRRSKVNSILEHFKGKLGIHFVDYNMRYNQHWSKITSILDGFKGKLGTHFVQSQYAISLTLM